MIAILADLVVVVVAAGSRRHMRLRTLTAHYTNATILLGVACRRFDYAERCFCRSLCVVCDQVRFSCVFIVFPHEPRTEKTHTQSQLCRM